MIDLRRLLRRPRILDEAWFALGGAVIGGAGGLLIAAFDLPPAVPQIPAAPTAAHWFLALAPGFGVGWWAGLLWSVLFAMAARRLSPPPPVGSLLPLAGLVVLITVGGAGAAHALDLPARTGILAAIGLGTVVARVRLARTARTPGPS